MEVYPLAALIPKGSKVVHVQYGLCTVIKTKKKDPHTVWIKMDDDGVEGTCDVRSLRWPSE